MTPGSQRVAGIETDRFRAFTKAFHDAFGLGESDQRISTVDADGVALAALQGLIDCLDENEERIDKYADLIEIQAGRIAALEDENGALRERLVSLESEVAALAGDSRHATPADD